MEMFRFGNQEALYLLAILPILTLLYIYYRISRKRAIRKFGNPELLAPLMPNASSSRPAIKFTLALLAIAFIIMGLARPQFGAKLQKMKREGVEIMIALDVSNSMMAEDIQPNRLERAKRAIARLTERLNNDKIGLIVFAGDAYIQIPITTDYNSAKMFLSAINTSVVPKQGTAIGAAINLALNSFSLQSETSKAVIVITDGENHEDDAIGAAKGAFEKNIVVHTIGMGLPQGGPIPIYNPNGQKDFMRDRQDNVIVTRLDEKMMQEIAISGGGTYVRASNTEVGINKIFEEISQMEKTELETRIFSDYNEQFIYFFIVALALLLFDYLLMERKNILLKNFTLFK